MDYEKLLRTLEIEDGSQLEYFEHYAHLMESDEEIDQDALILLLQESREDVLKELNQNYFNELLRLIPDEEVELYAHVEAIKRHMDGLLSSSKEIGIAEFADAVYSFREWFSVEEHFAYREKGQWVSASLRDVLSSVLLDKIEEAEREYDFNNYEEFSMDDYYVDLTTLRDDLYEGEDEED